MVVNSDFIESSVHATFVFHFPLMDLGKVAKMVSMEILPEPTHTDGQLTVKADLATSLILNTRRWLGTHT